MHILLADDLPLKGRSVRYRHGNLFYLHLETSNLYGFLHYLVIYVLFIGLFGHGHNVLICADTCGKNLRYIGIGYGGEAEVNGSRGLSVFSVIDLVKGQHKSIGSVLVIDQVAAIISGLNSTEGHGHA